MKILIALNFAVLALIMSGLLLISKANYKNFSQSSKFWTTAIVCDIFGLFLFALMFLTIRDFTEHNFIFGTVANTLLFASLIYQTASIHAIKKDITVSNRRYIMASIIVFALVWNWYRTYAESNQKLLTFAALALVVLLWQLYEIKKSEGDSNQRNIIFYAVVGEVFFTCLRIFAVAEVIVTIISADQLPIVGIAAVWMQYALKVIAYAALVGYWSESLIKKKVQVELETQAYKSLIERQDKLIADLGRLNKAATTGALAASIAHELSQPLQGLQLDNDLVRSESVRTNPDMKFINSLLQSQATNVQRMVEIIATLRGVFSESGAVEQTVDMSEVVDRLGLLIQSQANKSGVVFQFERSGQTFVRIKMSEIQQVLLNLVGNAFDALRASRVDSPTIKVSLNSDEAWVTCSIEDNGPGIEMTKQADVFKFLNTSKSNGMGLGLWLSKYMVERNRGEICIGDSDLGGAKFTVKLPVFLENT